MSPRFISRPSMTMPSVEVMPTRRPISLRMWATIRTVVVLPLVPVTARIGMRAGVPGGNSRSMTGLATYCGSPSVGWVCIRNPGAALTSTMPPPVSRTGVAMSGQMKSMPAMSRPTTRAAVSAISMLSGWASIVRSIEVPPVDMLPVSASFTKAPGVGDAVGRVALALEHAVGVLVEPDLRQHLLVADAAPRVRVGRVDQLADRVLAVADDVRRDALRDRRELAADHEDPVVAAGDVGLDDRRRRYAALAERDRERGADLVLGPQVQGDAAAVVAVERLDARTGSRGARAASTASSSVSTTSERGTGSPAESRSRLVSFLSDAMSTAMPLVRDGHRRPDPLLVDALARAGRG